MTEPLYRANVLVCGGTGCEASGSSGTYQALVAELQRQGLENEIQIVHTGCRGFCAMGPVVIIYPDGIFYCQVKAEDIPVLVEETLLKGRVVQRLTYKEPSSHQAVPFYSQIPFYSKQLRITLRNCGMIDPEEIDEYIARDGYQALIKVLSSMTPHQVCEEVKGSGLRGRGGAGFLTGLKWELTARAPGSVKYVVCNADEGDPGAFMDRSLIEGDPHSLIEGMSICAYTIGAREGYIYCRAEYPLAIKRLQIAIAQAEEYGLLGDRILGTDFSFRLYVKEGAGAFVCGEETALLASIEGRRGEPRPRPPFPSVRGLWDKPTNLNNVKSYCNVPQIILNGADWFADIGSPRSPGTAIFALTGKVNNTGLVEVPMGITLGEIIFDIGGGIPNGKKFKAVQTGGPLGGCIPAEHLNVKVDFDSLKEVGAVMGSGGMIVVDEDTCMVEFAKFFLTFATAESCGKCIPCRAGGKRMLEVLSRITEGKGRPEDIEAIRAIAAGMETGSLCALGQLTPGPVQAALRYFLDEFIIHIEEKRCPAGVCNDLVEARCLNACPAGVDVPSYITLTEQGRTAEAIAIHRERNPFVVVCGRVCPAFCEERCRRGDIDEPVAIRAIKRYMSDVEMSHPWTPAQLAQPNGKKVAVVGAGPAGLTAALRLVQMGYGVTVFEKLPVAGGMMRVGIPDYRLPPDLLQVDIDSIQRAGVEIRHNQALGRDFSVDSLMAVDGYSAVVLAIGAHLSSKLRIEGEDKTGVVHGVAFLREVALGQAQNLDGKRVVVVGGGNVAIDAARTAWRLGADQVHVVYRRTRQDMPAYAAEIEAAEQEGITFHYLTNPVQVLGDGQVTGVLLQLQELGEFDRSGRRRPVAAKGSEVQLGCDLLIPAIGQITDLSWLDGNHADVPSARSRGMDVPSAESGGMDVPSARSRGADVPSAESGGMDVPSAESGGMDVPSAESGGMDVPSAESGGMDVPSARSEAADVPSAESKGMDVPSARNGGIAVNRDSTLVTNKALATSRPGVFAAGDAVLGPASIIQAVAQGNRVAVAVDRWLRTGETRLPVYEPDYHFPDWTWNLDDYANATRPPLPERPVAERRNFEEAELTLDAAAVREECRRCLRCDREWLERRGSPARPRAEAIPIPLPEAK